MQITIDLPDDIADHLVKGNGANLPRSVIEMVALEGYRSGRLTHAQVGRLLGIDYRFDVDAFLKRHGVSLHYGADDLGLDQETLRGLGV